MSKESNNWIDSELALEIKSNRIVKSNSIQFVVQHIFGEPFELLSSSHLNFYAQLLCGYAHIYFSGHTK